MGDTIAFANNKNVCTLFCQYNQSNTISPLWFWWTLKFFIVCCTEVWNLEKSYFSNYFCCLNNFKVASKKNCFFVVNKNNLSVLSVYSDSERKIDHIYPNLCQNYSFSNYSSVTYSFCPVSETFGWIYLIYC